MRLLIKKNTLDGKLLNVQELVENEYVVYEIVDNPPIIEERPTEIGHYELDSLGALIVVYEPKPKTEMDLISEKLDQILGVSTMAQEDGLINMDMIISSDEKLDAINAKIKGEVVL